MRLKCATDSQHQKLSKETQRHHNIIIDSMQLSCREVLGSSQVLKNEMVGNLHITIFL